MKELLVQHYGLCDHAFVKAEKMSTPMSKLFHSPHFILVIKNHRSHFFFLISQKKKKLSLLTIQRLNKRIVITSAVQLDSVLTLLAFVVVSSCDTKVRDQGLIETFDLTQVKIPLPTIGMAK